MVKPSALLGRNTSIEHRGRTFHVQTEDSGIERPHVITHLFARGGRIVATAKASYRDLVGDASYARHVRDLIRGQHAAMIERLLAGAFDEQIAADALLGEPSLAPAAPVASPVAPAPAATAAPIASPVAPVGSPPGAAPTAPAAPAPTALATPAPIAPAPPRRVQVPPSRELPEAPPSLDDVIVADVARSLRRDDDRT